MVNRSLGNRACKVIRVDVDHLSLYAEAGSLDSNSLDMRRYSLGAAVCRRAASKGRATPCATSHCSSTAKTASGCHEDEREIEDWG